jgi:hypothetical protein
VVFAAVLAWDAADGVVAAVCGARVSISSDPLADGVFDWPDYSIQLGDGDGAAAAMWQKDRGDAGRASAGVHHRALAERDDVFARADVPG